MTKPKLSVVIPTYNRSDLLQTTLSGLANQTVPTGQFEVVVSDDGSTDATLDVTRWFTRKLRLRYTFQEDLGFRAAAARNAGARLATSPTIAFIDTGVVPGPDFVRAHLREAQPGRAVIGYTYGSNSRGTAVGLAEALTRLTPQQVRDRYAAQPDFWDQRHRTSGSPDFGIGRRRIPWMYFWSLNISLTTADFWSAGGFDEEFQSWGLEDLELGYRLFKRGISLSVSQSAWAVESPHERDHAANLATSRENALRLLLKHREPVLELCWTWLTDQFTWSLEREYGALLDWTLRARQLRVAEEIASAVSGMPAGSTVAIFGCGQPLPELPERYLLFDFDRELLAAPAVASRTAEHAIGIRTALADDSVDLVILTSRTRGLTARQQGWILAEAGRIGRSVHPVAA